MNIKNIFRLMLAVAVSVTTFAGCSKWTESESVEFRYVTLEESDPAMYESYLQSLRDYRESDHKVLIAKFDNKAGNPVGQADHIAALPDSVDYIVLKNPAALSDTVIEEMAQVREIKGQKVLCQIDVKSILDDYKAYVEQWTIANAESPAEDLIPQNDFVAEKMATQIALFGQYSYDGISIAYSCRNPLSVSEENKPAFIAEQETVLGPVAEWVAANPDALFMLEGTPQNLLVHNELLEEADYILVPTLSSKTGDSFTYEVGLVSRFANIPADRFVVCVTARSLTDANDTNGTFAETGENGEEISAIVGAAYWVRSANDDFGKAGISVDNAQNDYFDLDLDYRNIRKAISVMNPSPLN